MGLGGREFAVLSIVEGLLERGHDALLAVQPRSRLEAIARETKLPCETLTMSKLAFPAAIQAFRKLIQRRGIEVIHTHSSRDRWMATIAAHLSPQRPVVILGRHHCGAIRDSILNRLLYGRLSHCIVTTGGASLRDQLIRENGFHPSRVVSIPTGVDLSRFTPGLDGNSLRAELGIPADAFVAGTVSFLRNYKGLHYFIEAAALVLAKDPRVRFVITGDGPERDRLSAQIRQAGLAQTVLMVGHRTDVPHVIAGIDLCVVASTGTETLTQVIPQAFAMEKPVLATRVGGIPDIVADHVTGLLIPPRNSRALAEGILWCIANRNRARELAQAGRRLVVARYSTQSTVNSTERLYTELLRLNKTTGT